MDHLNHPRLFNRKGHIGFYGHGVGICSRNVRVLDLSLQKATDQVETILQLFKGFFLAKKYKSFEIIEDNNYFSNRLTKMTIP